MLRVFTYFYVISPRDSLVQYQTESRSFDREACIYIIYSVVKYFHEIHASNGGSQA